MHSFHSAARTGSSLVGCRFVPAALSGPRGLSYAFIGNPLGALDFASADSDDAQKCRVASGPIISEASALSSCHGKKAASPVGLAARDSPIYFRGRRGEKGQTLRRISVKRIDDPQEQTVTVFAQKILNASAPAVILVLHEGVAVGPEFESNADKGPNKQPSSSRDQS